MHIRLENVTKNFDSVHALNDVSLDITPGQIVALLGVNGAGKSTLLRCLSALVIPDRGRIFYDGELFRRGRLDLRRRFMFMPDFPVIYANHTVLEHISMVLRLYEQPVEGREKRVWEVLRNFDLLPCIDSPLSKLSRGQIYKAALAALFLLDPEVWLLDEPFASGMDPLGISYFKQQSREAIKRGRTILYSTQIIEVVEAFSDRVCMLHQGKVEFFDSLANAPASTDPSHNALERLFAQLREDRA